MAQIASDRAHAALPKCACGNTACLDGPQCRQCYDRDKAERNKDAKIRNVTDAIEAFVQARIAYDLGIRRVAPLAASHAIDVKETREHLRDKLAELIS